MPTDNSPVKILIADDDKDYVDLFIPSVEGEGRIIYTAHTPRDVLGSCNAHYPEVVFLDYDFKGQGLGLQLLKKIKNKLPETIVVMITAKGTEKVEMEAMKLGAFNYLNKDDDPELNERKINRIVEMVRRGREHRDATIQNNMVGFEKIEEIHNMINKFAKYDDAVVLITGESGTGKQLVAKNIHLQSRGESEPFLTFNCCAVPDSLIEAQLFGFKRGAFTGAIENNDGIFQSAGSGTVFLDEIGSASLNFQLKLLHILETGEYFSIGDYTPKTCNARIILATNENLERAVEEGRFRKDLYYRINSLNVKLPSLSELQKDIPLLMGYLLAELSRKHKQQKRVSSELIQTCKNIYWDGNVRELRGALERCLLLTEPGETITSKHFHKYYNPSRPFNCKADNAAKTLKEQVEIFEKGLIENALSKTRTQKEAAGILGVIEATLSEKIKKYNLRRTKLQ